MFRRRPFGEFAVSNWAEGDLNNDGHVDLDDIFLILAANKLDQGLASSAPAAAVQVVSEPAAFTLAVAELLGLVICGLGRRGGEGRRRNRDNRYDDNDRR